MGLRVLTRPNADKLPEIYRTLGTDYAERVLPSIIQVGWVALGQGGHGGREGPRGGCLVMPSRNSQGDAAGA